MRMLLRSFGARWRKGQDQTGTSCAVSMGVVMTGHEQKDLEAQELALEDRLRVLEGRLERTTRPSEGEECLRERAVLQRRLEAVRLVRRNLDAQQRAAHDAAAQAERGAALQRRREEIQTRLVGIVADRAALLDQARTERPDLVHLAWELPPVRRLGAEQTGLERELITVHQALALATEEACHAV